MEKLVLTGGSGFIGRNLLPLISDKYDVYVLSSKSDLVIPGFSGNIVTCDLLSPTDVQQVMSDIAPEKLIHLAWGMEPSNYNLPSNFSWLTASMHLLEAFQQCGGKSVMVAGSCVQYDWSLGGCHEESTPRANNSTYGHCKNILQDYALSFCEAHEMQCLWARPFFMYGPHEDDRRLAAYLMKSMVQGEEATVQNGAIYRDFLHAEDVASLMLALFESEASGSFNIASGEMHSLGEVGQKIAELTGTPELLKIKIPDAVSNKYVFANTDKVSAAVNWQPKYSFESGLAATIEWWRGQSK